MDKGRFGDYARPTWTLRGGSEFTNAIISKAETAQAS